MVGHASGGTRAAEVARRPPAARRGGDYGVRKRPHAPACGHVRSEPPEGDVRAQDAQATCRRAQHSSAKAARNGHSVPCDGRISVWQSRRPDARRRSDGWEAAGVQVVTEGAHPLAGRLFVLAGDGRRRDEGRQEAQPQPRLPFAAARLKGGLPARLGRRVAGVAHVRFVRAGTAGRRGRVRRCRRHGRAAAGLTFLIGGRTAAGGRVTSPG